MVPSRAPEEGSHAAEQHNHTHQKRIIQCDACYEDVPARGALSLPDCEHVYCAKCISIMFGYATKNEESFPPSCCEHAIEIKDAACCLHRPQIVAYEKSAAEFNTPAVERRYCSDLACSTFLGSANNDILRCDKCGKLTCCKHAHTGKCYFESEIYQQEQAEQAEQLQKLINEEGWQRCPKCGQIIELMEACNHITCDCHHQFCYLCAAEWDTCPCPLYGRGHLPLQQQQHQHAPAMNPPLDPGRPADVWARIDLIVRNLENAYGARRICRHYDRIHNPGPERCDQAECRRALDTYHFLCTECGEVFCQACHDRVIEDQD